MAFWWVNQGKTYAAERTGGYLWAPRDGSQHHWKRMLDVRSGDTIFSYVDRRIVAIAIAQGPAKPTPRPRELEDEDAWPEAGNGIQVQYRDIDPPVAIPLVWADLHPLLPGKYSPMNTNGDGNQGYLYPLTPQAAAFLLERAHSSAGASGDALLDEAVEAAIPDSTERQAIIQSRVGQGKFRDQVLGYWGQTCAVTGCSLTAVLRASHIKPWRDSDNIERLDRHNGLALAPNLDALFDRGFISFADDGCILISRNLPQSDMQSLSIHMGWRMTSVHEAHRKYLAHHREYVFKG